VSFGSSDLQTVLHMLFNSWPCSPNMCLWISFIPDPDFLAEMWNDSWTILEDFGGPKMGQFWTKIN